MKETLSSHLKKLKKLSVEELVNTRIEKFSSMGAYIEE